MNDLLKKGLFVLLGLGMTVACSDDDDTPGDGGGSSTAIENLTFTAEAGGDGTEITVTPSSSGATAYSVDFGDLAAENDADVMATAGPGVTYDYPNVDATYSISVTASASGAEDVIITQDVNVTYTAPAASPLEGTWVLKHDTGSLFVGPDAEKGTMWWQNEAQTILDRSCLYDDKYVFNADFTFENQMGDETWINWTAENGAPENCGAPESPMDGTGSYTYSHDQDNNKLTLSGKGAHLGLAKVVNGPYLNSASEAAETITYDILSIEQNEFEVRIMWDNGGTDAYWYFTFAREGSAGADFDQTDTDSDGVIDIFDICPDEAGTEENGCPPAGEIEDPMDDFEGTGNITWVADGNTLMNTSTANPSKTGINTSDTVLEYTDNNQQYANIRFDLNEAKTAKFDLTEKHTFKVMVYVPTPTQAHTEAKTLALKLQDGSSSTPWEGQTSILQNYEYDVWQELTFDFSDVSTETKYSRIVVQFNGENNYEDVKAYIDNFKYE